MNRDLSYFYLGVCAENLGYLEASEKYFKQSYHLYQNGQSHNRCKDDSFCNGIKLDIELSNHISALKRAKQKLADAAEAARASETEITVQESPPKTAKTADVKKKSKEILKAQQVLIDEGYNVGEVDGRANERYQKALKKYQADHGLVATGQLNTATRSSLGIANLDMPKENAKKAADLSEKTDSLPVQKENAPTAPPAVTEKQPPGATEKTEKEITIASIPVKMASPPVSSSKKTIIAETTTIMVEPNVMSDNIGEIPVGTGVEVIEEKNNFLKIRYNDKEGFVHSNFVKTVN